MGGGLFGTPIELNFKCILFSLFVISVYWLPRHENMLFNSFILGMFSYVILAWYDYIYSCNDKLGISLFSWTTLMFKPKEYTKKWNKLPTKYKKRLRIIDVIILIGLGFLFIWPFIKKNLTWNVFQQA
jgi:hypothetical protein